MTTPTDTAKLADDIEALAKKYQDAFDYIRAIPHDCQIPFDKMMELESAERAITRVCMDKSTTIIAALRELEAVKAENAKLREAVSHADRCERFVKLVAGQKLSEQAREWQEEEYGDDGDPDFEGAYDTFIEQARNIINERRAALGGAG